MPETLELNLITFPMHFRTVPFAAHFGLIAAFALMNPSAHSAVPASDWVVLNSLPDPIGYAGMAAGVIGGRLVATGGTQWSQPVWLKGTRKFNDEIFVLGGLDQKWQVSSARLPVASGHFASAASGQAIYFAGGTHPGGCLATAYELRAEGGGYVTRRLADLPKPIGYAAGAIVGNRFFLIGGVPDPTSTQPTNEVWSLDLSSPTARWDREADLPGPGLLVPAASSSGTSVFVFGGMAYDAAGQPVPSAAAYHLPKAGGIWERLPDIPQPRVGINTPCPVLTDGTIWLIGGYSEVWRGAQREHPGFAEQTYFYNIARRTWATGPKLPNVGAGDRDVSGDVGPLPTIGAPVAVWQNHVTVVGGEVRISTRTPSVIAWPLSQ